MGRVPESPTQPEGFYPKKYLQTRKILKIPQFIYYLKTQNKLKKDLKTRPEPEKIFRTWTRHLATRPITKFLHIYIFNIILEFLDL